MRHKSGYNRLGRQQSLRKATVRDIAKATLLKERISTTKAKAKEARKLVEKLITLGKKGTLADKRRAFAILCDHKIVSDLFSKTSPRFKSRVGGYTRIIPCGNRRGDNAHMVLLELTEKSPEAVEKESPKEAKEVQGAAKAVEGKAEPAPAKEKSFISKGFFKKKIAAK